MVSIPFPTPSYATVRYSAQTYVLYDACEADYAVVHGAVVINHFVTYEDAAAVVETLNTTTFGTRP